MILPQSTYFPRRVLQPQNGYAVTIIKGSGSDTRIDTYKLVQNQTSQIGQEYIKWHYK